MRSVFCNSAGGLTQSDKLVHIVYSIGIYVYVSVQYGLMRGGLVTDLARDGCNDEGDCSVVHTIFAQRIQPDALQRTGAV